MTYHKDVVKIIAHEMSQNDSQAYSFWVYDMNGLRIGQGADAFSMNSDLLDGYLEFLKMRLGEDEHWFYHDDFLLSVFLNLRNVYIQCNKSQYEGGYSNKWPEGKKIAFSDPPKPI